MTIKDLCVEIATHEGLKKEVSYGNIREIVGVLSDIMFDEEYDDTINHTVLNLLWLNGKRRAKKGKKK